MAAVRRDRKEAAAAPTWGQYLAFLRRHATFLLLGPALGLAAGSAWAVSQPVTYSATTTLVAHSVEGYVSADGRTRPERVTIDSDAQLVHHSQVHAAVARVVGDSRQVVGERLSVSAVPLSRVLRITYTADTPAAASEGADAAAGTFLRVREAALLALDPAQTDRLGRRLRAVETSLVRQNRVNSVIDVDDPLLEQLSVLRGRLMEIELVRLQPAEVLNRAGRPSAADSADNEVPLISGVMMGLLVACVAGSLLDGLRSGAQTRGSPMSSRRVGPLRGSSGGKRLNLRFVTRGEREERR